MSTQTEEIAPAERVVVSNGHSFRRTTWNGISVVQEIDSGYYSANNVCRENGKRFEKILSKNYWRDYVAALNRHLANQRSTHRPQTGPVDMPNAAIEIPDVSPEFRGTYVHPYALHFLCEHVNYEYAIKVSELMNLINERNQLTHQTLEQTIENYKTEIEALKSKNESKNHSLNELEAELVARAIKIDELESEIHDLTTPIDTRFAPPTAYAKPVGNDYFQLKVSASILGPNVPTLRRESFIGAIACVQQAKQELKKRKLLVKYEGSNVISRENLEETFDILHQIKARQTIAPVIDRNEWLDEQIAYYRSRRQTAQAEGKLFELEYIRQHEELTPWDLVPKEIKNQLNEFTKDTGIDAVVIDEKEAVRDIVQLKYKRPSKNGERYNLRMKELVSFVSKCEQERYQHLHKRLVLKGCILGPRIRKTLEALHIDIEIIE